MTRAECCGKLWGEWLSLIVRDLYFIFIAIAYAILYIMSNNSFSSDSAMTGEKYETVSRSLGDWHITLWLMR
jgi:hypothetical protein